MKTSVKPNTKPTPSRWGGNHAAYAIDARATKLSTQASLPAEVGAVWETLLSGREVGKASSKVHSDFTQRVA